MCGHLDQRLPYNLAMLAEVIDEIISHPQWDPIVLPMRPTIVMTAEQGVTIGRWGWKNPSKVDVHARRESLKTTWRAGYEGRRCAIPCAGWWESTWHFSGSEVLWLAGIWRSEDLGPAARPKTGPAVLVVTGDAGAKWQFQSDRHPIALTLDQAKRWCDQPDEATTLDQPVTEISLDGLTSRGVSQQTLFDTP